LLPISRQLKWIESACGTDDDSLRAAQENSKTFFFNRCVKAANDRAVFRAPALREINCIENFVARTRF
jgi:hypothetical protein